MAKSRVFAPGSHLWMPSSQTSTRCCMCCVVRRNGTHAIIHCISTTSRKVANLTNDDRQYSSLLTPYAYNLVLSQIALRDAANVSVDGTPVLSTKGPLFVATSSCECVFRASYRLPCRHIFVRRKVDGHTSYVCMYVCMYVINDGNGHIARTFVQVDESLGLFHGQLTYIGYLRVMCR